MKYCPNCGRANQENSKFCMYCGTKFDEVKENENVETVNAEFTENKTITNNESSLGKLSMILGIISVGLLIICCCFPVSVIVGPIAIITGIVSLTKNKGANKKLAILGIVLGSIALLLSIVSFVCMEPFLELMEEMAHEICNQDPNSDECLLYKENFPGWFD